LLEEEEERRKKKGREEERGRERKREEERGRERKMSRTHLLFVSKRLFIKFLYISLTIKQYPEG